MKYSSVHILFNSNSTGDSKAIALELRAELNKRLSGLPVKILPTKYPGHGEKLARNIAVNNKHPLIVSCSGDGGYNEVINGVMDAGKTGAVCAVLPAGNANDHSRTMQDKPLWKAIVASKVTKIDLLKVTMQTNNKKTMRFAHSYIGLGLTPLVAVELNKHKLNAAKEVLIVVRTFFKHRPFKIQHQGNILKLDSLLFANINQMAKLLTLAPTNHPDDGKFEIISFASANKILLIKQLTKAAVTNLKPQSRDNNYFFKTVKKMPMQMDGELVSLEAACTVRIECLHRALKTVV